MQFGLFGSAAARRGGPDFDSSEGYRDFIEYNIEAEALAPSALVGKPLRDLDITEGIRIGAVFRQGEVLAPTGDTVIAAHDRLVVFATAAKYKEIEQIFRVSLEFF